MRTPRAQPAVQYERGKAKGLSALNVKHRRILGVKMMTLSVCCSWDKTLQALLYLYNSTLARIHICACNSACSAESMGTHCCKENTCGVILITFRKTRALLSTRMHICACASTLQACTKPRPSTQLPSQTRSSRLGQVPEALHCFVSTRCGPTRCHQCRSPAGFVHTFMHHFNPQLKNLMTDFMSSAASPHLHSFPQLCGIIVCVEGGGGCQGHFSETSL
eukprot:1144353-Pelagomonas_calceolata.AAC.3